jgi:hypothetical protein
VEAEFHLWSVERTDIKKLIVFFRNFAHALKTAHGGADQHFRKIYVQILRGKTAVCDMQHYHYCRQDECDVFEYHASLPKPYRS